MHADPIMRALILILGDKSSLCDTCCSDGTESIRYDVMRKSTVRKTYFTDSTREIVFAENSIMVLADGKVRQEEV